MAVHFARFDTRKTSRQTSPDYGLAAEIARLLDGAFVLPGTRLRLGLDSLIGLVPGVGDLLTTGLGAFIVYEGWRRGLPRTALMRMAANLAIDATLGSVPLVGDVFDVFFKANQMNLRILREHLDRQEGRR